MRYYSWLEHDFVCLGLKIMMQNITLILQSVDRLTD